MRVSEAEAKNLVEVESQTGVGQREATEKTSADIKGKIVEFSWWMLREGYTESTIRLRTEILQTLVKRGANIHDPEDVKRVIALQDTWSDGRKANAVTAYSCFLNMLGLEWKPPRYKYAEKLPFIPLEGEIDGLTAGCGKKTSAFLQGLKETGADPGELWRVEWIDIDVEKRVVRINHPVKGHNPRILPISTSWIGMLQRLPKKGLRVFGNGRLGNFTRSYRKQRQSLSRKLGNPRILEIRFTTLRHWKGTTEYHKTRDIIHVQRILGHKDVRNTMIYINLDAALFQAESDEFHVKVAETIEEACSLMESGFTYVGRIHGVEVFRKRK